MAFSTKGIEPWLYSHEAWVMTEKVLSHVQAAVMGFLQNVYGKFCKLKIRLGCACSLLLDEYQQATKTSLKNNHRDESTQSSHFPGKGDTVELLLKPPHSVAIDETVRVVDTVLLLAQVTHLESWTIELRPRRNLCRMDTNRRWFLIPRSMCSWIQKPKFPFLEKLFRRSWDSGMIKSHSKIFSAMSPRIGQCSAIFSFPLMLNESTVQRFFTKDRRLASGLKNCLFTLNW